MRVATESSPPKPPSRTPAAACQPPWPSVLMQRIGERDPPRLIFSMLYAKLLDSLDAGGSVPGARSHPLRREPSSVDRTAARTKAAAWAHLVIVRDRGPRADRVGYSKGG